MTTSPKRLGMDVGKDNLELELRLRRIEAELERCVKSSDAGDSDDVQRVSTVPQVTGLRVKGKTAGAVSLAWNQVRISDLRRYELWIAEDLAFSENLQTFNVAGTEYTFSTISTTGGGGNTTIYAKVRARTRSGNVGPFSAVLNTATGQAQTDDIADDSVTVEKVVIEGVGPTVWTSENDGPGSGLESDNADTVDYLHKIDLLTYETSTPLYYESDLTVISNASDHSFEHGLNGVPRLFQAYVVCVEAELGFSVGDEIPISWDSGGTSAEPHGIVCRATSTHIIVRVGLNGLNLLSSATWRWANATSTKWQIYVRGWA